MTYADAYRNIDFRKHPEQYQIGRGEQGVLMAEPYKSEILQHWKFKTEADAKESAAKIYQLFQAYGKDDDFVGMDMARKFLQMGFTRARRYANIPLALNMPTTAALRRRQKIGRHQKRPKPPKYFYEQYVRAKSDSHYLELKQIHKDSQKSSWLVELRVRQ